MPGVPVTVMLHREPSGEPFVVPVRAILRASEQPAETPTGSIQVNVLELRCDNGEIDYLWVRETPDRIHELMQEAERDALRPVH